MGKLWSRAHMWPVMLLNSARRFTKTLQSSAPTSATWSNVGTNYRSKSLLKPEVKTFIRRAVKPLAHWPIGVQRSNEARHQPH